MNSLKKYLKFLGSRSLYLVLGISFAFVVISVKAAITSTDVASGNTLTASIWNTMLADIRSLDLKFINLDSRVSNIEGISVPDYYGDIERNCAGDTDPYNGQDSCWSDTCNGDSNYTFTCDSSYPPGFTCFDVTEEQHVGASVCPDWDRGLSYCVRFVRCGW